MVDILPIVLSGVIGTFGGSIGAYVIAKRMFNSEKITIIADELLSEVAQNEALQRKIYMVGGILGKGIGAGAKLAVKGGRGFKMDDLIGLAVSQFLPKILGTTEQQEQPAQQSEKLFGALP